MSYQKALIILLTMFSSLFIRVQPELFSMPKDEGFHSYWYNYGAEISRFELKQERYGDIHPGYAVLIFVTEPFLPDIQVKADSKASKQKSIPILKLNFIKRFDTGIYDYSMMKSVFTPIPDNDSKTKKTLKVSTTRQDWCGHSFIQYNLKDGHYLVSQNSYFEKKGDRTVTSPPAYLEDEIWTWIRISPNSLPLGEFEMIPGSFFTTLRLTDIKAEKAHAELADLKEGDISVSQYTITYPSSDRTLSIRFTQNFPHEILSWKETYMSGPDKNAKLLTTHAKRTNEVMMDYWNKNRVKDMELKKQLGLTK